MTVKQWSAWCFEFGRVVSAEEAHRHSVAARSRASFTFGCTDALCRAGANPAFVGIHIASVLPASGAKRSRHFRLKAGHKHDRACSVGGDEPLHAGKPLVVIGADGKKVSNVADRFEPLYGDGPPENGARSADVCEPSMSVSAVEALRRPAGGLSSEYRVEQLWNQYQALGGPGARSEAYIELGRSRVAYQELFQRPSNLSADQAHRCRVLFGSASYCRSVDGSSFELEFYDALELFPTVGTLGSKRRSLRIVLPIARLAGTIVGRSLWAQLTGNGAARAHYFHVVAFGDVRAAATTGYELELRSLFDLALSARLVKRPLSDLQNGNGTGPR